MTEPTVTEEEIARMIIRAIRARTPWQSNAEKEMSRVILALTAERDELRAERDAAHKALVDRASITPMLRHMTIAMRAADERADRAEAALAETRLWLAEGQRLHKEEHDRLEAALRKIKAGINNADWRDDEMSAEILGIIAEVAP